MKTNLAQNSLRVLLGLLMIFAGVTHVTFLRQEFIAQVPVWIPNTSGLRDFVVLASGAIEILFGIAMVFYVRRKIAVGISLAVFYILIFPGNISQYNNHISGFGLDTNEKRLIRLFFQPLFVFWALWSTGAWRYIFHKKTDDK